MRWSSRSFRRCRSAKATSGPDAIRPVRERPSGAPQGRRVNQRTTPKLEADNATGPALSRRAVNLVPLPGALAVQSGSNDAPCRHGVGAAAQNLAGRHRLQADVVHLRRGVAFNSPHACASRARRWLAKLAKCARKNSRDVISTASPGADRVHGGPIT